MSPLSPVTIEAAKRKDSTPNNNLLITSSGPGSRFHYSVNQLYELRHEENIVQPRISDQTVFESVRRSGNNNNNHHQNTLSMSNQFNNMFSNSGSTSLNRLGGRSNRSIFRPPTLLSSDIGDSYNSHNQQSGPQQRSGNNYQNQGNFNRGSDRALYGGRKSSQRASRPSSREEVRLKEAENAWKPTFMLKKSNDANNTNQTDELYRQVRAILNKLTAKNFPVLSEQFRQLQIDTKEKLSGVVDLVFEKAVNEPNFSVEYAQLCSYLSERSRSIMTSPTERAYFKRMLINKCQIEFEQNVANKNTTEVALAPLFDKLKLCEKDGASNDAILEIKEQIADEESKLRRRLVCTVRFIGELYKLDMLTTNIMNVCIKSLIDSRTDEKLECVCKLLTTVGRKLERKPKTEEDKAKYLNLGNYMNQLKQIAERKIPNVKVSTRIRFMIMDVIELRANQWKPKTRIDNTSTN